VPIPRPAGKLADMMRRRLSPKGRGIALIATGLNAFAGAAGIFICAPPAVSIFVAPIVLAGVFFIVRGNVWLRRQSPPAIPASQTGPAAPPDRTNWVKRIGQPDVSRRELN